MTSTNRISSICLRRIRAPSIWAWTSSWQTVSRSMRRWMVLSKRSWWMKNLWATAPSWSYATRPRWACPFSRFTGISLLHRFTTGRSVAACLPVRSWARSAVPQKTGAGHLTCTSRCLLICWIRVLMFGGSLHEVLPPCGEACHPIPISCCGSVQGLMPTPTLAPQRSGLNARCDWDAISASTSGSHWRLCGVKVPTSTT